jgi:mono/diheme cytochrome c family protein
MNRPEECENLMPKFARDMYVRQAGRMQNACGAALVAFFWAALPAPLLAQSLQIPKPSPGLMPNATLGKALYQKNCASCHGQDLKGTSKGPPFLHRVYEPSHHADAAFQLAARSGVRAHHWQFGDMQPVAAVTPDDVAHITAFIRMAQRKAGIN